MDTLIFPFLLALFAGLSTGIGSLVAFYIPNLDKRYLSVLLGFSAGVMITVSFVELLDTAINSVGFFPANLVFFGGMIVMFGADYLIPHEYISEKVDVRDKDLMRTGIFTAFGIALHNFPEGLVVMVAGLNSTKLGLLLAFAIALHNIPEGISVSVPLYFATNDRKKAFKYSFLSGLTEPVGALIGGLILFPFLNELFLQSLLAFTAGIMVFISLDELLPSAYDCVCELGPHTRHLTIFGIIAGMIVMSFSLFLLS